jgi:methyl-accepting chemotaxis protein
MKLAHPKGGACSAGGNPRAYLIQSYARDMGNGKTIMMREMDVPIRVQGRHWGGLRTAYKL